MNDVYYLVGVLKKELSISVLGKDATIDLIFSNGMVGNCPVFDNRKDAELYAGDIFPIFAITLKDQKEKTDGRTSN